MKAIADAATVSRRTFSNYFSSIEEALFHPDRPLPELIHEAPGFTADRP